MAKVRYIDNPVIVGSASSWNPHGIMECIVYFPDGSATSEFARLLEPIEMTREEWYDEMNKREP